MTKAKTARLRNTLLACAAFAAVSTSATPQVAGSPILVEKQGAFAVGGKIVGDPDRSSLHCDHGVVEFQIPPGARAVIY